MRILTGCICLLLSGSVVADPPDPTLKTPDAFPRFAPVEPADVGTTFVVQGGFEMQLIAAEPLVTDPVAMAIDENGCALVVEMNDYPYTDSKSHKAWQDNTTDAPIGRVRWLEDTDNDGRFDRSTVFAEGLSWPSGIACYRGGVFVTATPDVWYLKDTDGDHKADIREKVFTGFRKYNVQAVMNNPIWGLDNKLYIAGSSNGGSVLAPGKTQSKPITARGDFRFDPRTLELELQAGERVLATRSTIGGIGFCAIYATQPSTSCWIMPTWRAIRILRRLQLSLMSPKRAIRCRSIGSAQLNLGETCAVGNGQLIPPRNFRAVS